MVGKHSPKPRLDRVVMRELGSNLRPGYDRIVKGPLPPQQRDLLLQYAVAEAVSEPEQRRPRLKLVPHLPS
jgi:hypothetical protein